VASYIRYIIVYYAAYKRELSVEYFRAKYTIHHSGVISRVLNRPCNVNRFQSGNYCISATKFTYLPFVQDVKVGNVLHISTLTPNANTQKDTKSQGHHRVKYNDFETVSVIIYRHGVGKFRHLNIVLATVLNAMFKLNIKESES